MTASRASPAISPIAPCSRPRTCRSICAAGRLIIWAGDKTHLVQYPLHGGELFNLVAVFHSDRYAEGWDSYGDPAELHARFADKCAEVRTLLNNIESWRMWVLCDREPIKEWSRGRVTLLGDAAHPMLQYLAQGACMAIEDSVCLADKMDESGGDFAAAFCISAGALPPHRPRADHGPGLWRVYHASGVARELRNLMLSSRTPEEAYVVSMAWLYGRQPELMAGAAAAMAS